MEFDYIIEGQEVKLKRYTGRDTKVIVPKFVTSLMYGYFRGCGIEEITLESGLKYIGGYAFESCNISKIIIPETIDFTLQTKMIKLKFVTSLTDNDLRVMT